MKKAELLLFNNVVYSTDPEDPKDQFLGPDPLYFSMFQNPDEEILDVIEPNSLNSKKLPNATKIFLPDKILTKIRKDVREQKKRIISKSEYDLSCIRKIITNDNYPVFVEFTRDFKHLTGKIKTKIMLGEYSIEFGRLPLVYLIQSIKYEKAIPELKEIIIHDSDNRMVQASIWALRDMHTNNSFVCINNLLLRGEFSYRKQYQFVVSAEKQGSPILLPGLRRCFEDNYYYYPQDYDHIYYNATIQQGVLEACSNIPSFGALEILKLGVSHPYDHVEKIAYLSLKKWIKMMLIKLQNNPNQTLGFKIAELIKLYDFDIFYQSYSKLKKKSTSFIFK